MPSRIPAAISRTEFLEAVKPLLDLLHTDGMEIGPDIFISRDAVTFVAFAAKAGDVAKHGIQLDDPPQEFAQLAYAIRVEVLDV